MVLPSDAEDTKRLPIYNFDMEKTKKVQYFSAVFLIITSVIMVAFQVFTINNVADGLLIYIGQAFLLVGSIFGLDYYIKKLENKIQA